MTQGRTPEVAEPKEASTLPAQVVLYAQEKQEDKPKDKWDKFSAVSGALSPLVTGLIVAIVGGLFTASQNSRNALLKQQEEDQRKRQVAQDAETKKQQAQLLELQTIAQLMPYLTSKDENKKQVAITAINELASTSLAVELAKLNKSPGTINALRQIATQSTKETSRNLAQAALVELEKSDTGPNKTLLKTEHGDCGPAGTGGDSATNLLVNRTDTPKTLRDMTPEEVMQLPIIEIPAGHRRDSWTPEELAKVTQAGEGSGVLVQGYLLRVNKESPTTANCRLEQYTDWHLYLGPDAHSATNHALVVVAGPRIRMLHSNWDLTKLHTLVAAQTPVRVSGWLFFNNEHLRGNSPPQFWATVWQIRPVVKIEFLKNGTWINLDDPGALQ